MGYGVHLFVSMQVRIFFIMKMIVPTLSLIFQNRNLASKRILSANIIGFLNWRTRTIFHFLWIVVWLSCSLENILHTINLATIHVRLMKSYLLILHLMVTSDYIDTSGSLICVYNIIKFMICFNINVYKQ